MSTLSTPAPSTDEGPRLGMLLTLFFAPAFIFANMYTTQAILPVFSQDFHISAPTAGLTVSLLVLAVAVGALIYGPISDAIGRKPVIVAASFLVTVPTLLCGFAPNFTILVILRALQGLLIPGLTSVAIPYVNEEFAGRKRGLVMGIYSAGLVFGGLLARVVSALLTGIFTWRIAMLAFTLPTLIAAFIIWRFLPDVYTRKQRVNTKNIQASRFTVNRAFVRQTLADMWMHLHNRHLVGIFMIGFSIFFGFIGIFTFLPYYLTGAPFHLPTIALSLVYLLWLMGMFSPIVGPIAMRIGSRATIILNCCAAIAGLLISLIPSLPIVMFGLALLALGMFSTLPAANLYLGEQARAAKGTAASMYLSLYYFGGSIGAVVPGIVLLWFGWTGVVLLCISMVFIALLADIVLCR